MDPILTFHKTVRGHLHITKEIPCEDYSLSYSDGDGRFHIAVVADGHGDPACTRSADGSKFVAEIALECLKDFAHAAFLPDSAQFILDFAENVKTPKYQDRLVRQLMNVIISRWYQRVQEDLEANPLTEEELEIANKSFNMGEVYRRGERLEHVYGTTLIAALCIREDYLILIQQGDGRCDVFYEDGHVEQPIPWDDRCFENICTSMCDEDVVPSIRYHVVDLTAQPVMACYMGSDGVEDSYRDMEGTHTFYRELSCKAVELGNVEAIEAHLEAMLPSFSESGSGDDVSVAAIVDLEKLKPFVPSFEALSQRYALEDSKLFYESKLASMTRKRGILKRRMEDIGKAAAEKETAVETAQHILEGLQTELEHIRAEREQAGARMTENQQLKSLAEEGKVEQTDAQQMGFPNHGALLAALKNGAEILLGSAQSQYKELCKKEKAKASEVQDQENVLAQLTAEQREIAEMLQNAQSEHDEYEAKYIGYKESLRGIEADMEVLLKASQLSKTGIVADAEPKQNQTDVAEDTASEQDPNESLS